MKKKSSEFESDNGLKPCFIITPIGKVNSESFIKTEGLVKNVLEPILEKFGFYPLPAHRIDNTGSITKQIIENIINCDLVIANLTGVNPNVMYELAIRHAFGKKVLILAEENTSLPFDIQDQRTIFYEDSMHGAEKLKPEMEVKIKNLLAETDEKTRTASPIYVAVQETAAIRELPEGERSGISLVISRLDDLEKKFYLNSRGQGRAVSTLNNPFETRSINYQINLKIVENVDDRYIISEVKKVVSEFRILIDEIVRKNNIIVFILCTDGNIPIVEIRPFIERISGVIEVSFKPF